MNVKRRARVCQIMSVLMVAVMLAGCTLPESVTMKRAPTVVLRLVTDLPKESQGYQQLQRFGELVAKASDQAMAVKLYALDEWGQWDSFYDHLALNTVQLACLSTRKLTAWVPQYEIYDLPYLFLGEGEVSAYLAGAKGEEALALLEPLGCKGLGFVGNGYDYFIQSKGPIQGVGDWSSLAMAAPQVPLYEQGLRVLGIKSVDENNLVTPFNSWCVDGAEVKKMISLKKINEGSILNDPEMFYQLDAVFADHGWWQALAEDQQSMLKICFSQAQTETMKNFTDQSLTQRFPEGGVTFDPLNDQVKNGIYEASRAMVNSYLLSGKNSLSGQWVTLPVAPENTKAE